ncbi:MAG: prenyltransferase [Syntrophales bacterium]|jgi:1,4-dihydroxy-2-naphthoate octaprenyltransferase|nr:prenyltransferase [Syntrophales bacterium]
MRVKTIRSNPSLLWGAAAKDRSKVAVWFQAFRFHYVPPSFLPAMICSIIAWTNGAVADLGAFLLVVAGVTINHAGLNMLDDVCDYLHSVDDRVDGEKNPYTGGSGVLTSGLLSTRQMIGAASLCFGITAGIGLYLAFAKGWVVLALGLFGLFCSVFYTLSPIKFGYRGLGELGLLVNFGPVIGLGSYYVQSGGLSAEPLAISLVLGFMMWSMIVINEIPDYESDRAGGKMNLVARFGKKTGIVLYIAGLACAYGILVASVLLRIAPAAALLGLVSLPLALKSIRILRENYHDSIAMTPANLLMIRVHLVTGLALIAGYALQFMIL